VELYFDKQKDEFQCGTFYRIDEKITHDVNKNNR